MTTYWYEKKAEANKKKFSSNGYNFLANTENYALRIYSLRKRDYFLFINVGSNFF